MSIKVKTYKDLLVWQQAHQVVLQLYRLTNQFPRTERYSLTDQVRRAAVSITSNIAEGFSRQSRKEKIQFYYISLGSLTEVDNQITIAKDLGYINQLEYDQLANQIKSVYMLLRRLVNSATSIPVLRL